jgi:siroheme synthase-like protein
MKTYYPIFLDIENREVVLVGGGAVCARKAETVLRYGARVTIVAPTFTEEIEAWGRDGRVTLRRKRYDHGDLEGATIVFASTDDATVNEQIAHDCRARRIPVNVADDLSLCEFIVPAVIENGSVQVAVSTGGKSPALARMLKRDLQRVIGPEYTEVNDLLGALRDDAKSALPTDADRKAFFDDLLAAGILEMLRAGKTKEAYETIVAKCAAAGVPVSDGVRQLSSSGS